MTIKILISNPIQLKEHYSYIDSRLWIIYDHLYHTHEYTTNNHNETINIDIIVEHLQIQYN
jgi:hypothetical protein